MPALQLGKQPLRRSWVVVTDAGGERYLRMRWAGGQQEDTW